MNKIIDPLTNKSISIFSKKGKFILKKFIKNILGGLSKDYSLIQNKQLFESSGWRVIMGNIHFSKLRNNLFVLEQTNRKISGSPYSRIGDFELSYTNENFREQFMKANLIYKYFLAKIKYSIQEIKDDSKNIYLPPMNNLELINSKIDYLKILKRFDLIDKETLLFDFNEEILSSAKFEELVQIMEELSEVDFEEGVNYPVIKTPYGGSSSCVTISTNSIYHVDKDYLYWLAVYLNTKPNKIDCIGYNGGLIIEKINKYIELIGEFRCFCVNGHILAITHSYFDTGIIHGTIDGMRFRKFGIRQKLLEKPLDLDILFLRDIDDSEFEIYFGIDILTKTIIGDKIIPYNVEFLKKNYYEGWEYDKGIETLNESKVQNIISKMNNFFRPIKIIEALKILCKKVFDKLNENGIKLTCNRIDICVSNNCELNEPKFIVNEIEDITFGPLSCKEIDKEIGTGIKNLMGNIYYNEEQVKKTV